MSFLALLKKISPTITDYNHNSAGSAIAGDRDGLGERGDGTCLQPLSSSSSFLPTAKKSKSHHETEHKSRGSGTTITAGSLAAMPLQHHHYQRRPPARLPPPHILDAYFTRHRYHRDHSSQQQHQPCLNNNVNEDEEKENDVVVDRDLAMRRRLDSLRDIIAHVVSLSSSSSSLSHPLRYDGDDDHRHPHDEMMHSHNNEKAELCQHLLDVVAASSSFKKHKQQQQQQMRKQRQGEQGLMKRYDDAKKERKDDDVINGDQKEELQQQRNDEEVDADDDDAAQVETDEKTERKRAEEGGEVETLHTGAKKEDIDPDDNNEPQHNRYAPATTSDTATKNHHEDQDGDDHDQRLQLISTVLKVMKVLLHVSPLFPQKSIRAVAMDEKVTADQSLSSSSSSSSSRAAARRDGDRGSREDGGWRDLGGRRGRESNRGGATLWSCSPIMSDTTKGSYLNRLFPSTDAVTVAAATATATGHGDTVDADQDHEQEHNTSKETIATLVEVEEGALDGQTHEQKRGKEQLQHWTLQPTDSIVRLGQLGFRPGGGGITEKQDALRHLFHNRHTFNAYTDYSVSAADVMPHPHSYYPQPKLSSSTSIEHHNMIESLDALVATTALLQQPHQPNTTVATKDNAATMIQSDESKTYLTGCKHLFSSQLPPPQLAKVAAHQSLLLMGKRGKKPPATSWGWPEKKKKKEAKDGETGRTPKKKKKNRALTEKVSQDADETFESSSSPAASLPLISLFRVPTTPIISYKGFHYIVTALCRASVGLCDGATGIFYVDHHRHHYHPEEAREMSTRRKTNKGANNDKNTDGRGVNRSQTSQSQTRQCRHGRMHVRWDVLPPMYRGLFGVLLQEAADSGSDALLLSHVYQRMKNLNSHSGVGEDEDAEGGNNVVEDEDDTGGPSATAASNNHQQAQGSPSSTPPTLLALAESISTLLRRLSRLSLQLTESFTDLCNHHSEGDGDSDMQGEREEKGKETRHGRRDDDGNAYNNNKVRTTTGMNRNKSMRAFLYVIGHLRQDVWEPLQGIAAVTENIFTSAPTNTTNDNGVGKDHRRGAGAAVEEARLWSVLVEVVSRHSHSVCHIVASSPSSRRTSASFLVRSGRHHRRSGTTAQRSYHQGHGAVSSNPAVTIAAGSLLLSALLPWHRALFSWITRGVLVASGGESFFIVPNPQYSRQQQQQQRLQPSSSSSSDQASVCILPFTVDHSRVPPFLSPVVAHHFLMAGIASWMLWSCAAVEEEKDMLKRRQPEQEATEGRSDFVDTDKIITCNKLLFTERTQLYADMLPTVSGPRSLRRALYRYLDQTDDKKDEEQHRSHPLSGGSGVPASSPLFCSISTGRTSVSIEGGRLAGSKRSRTTGTDVPVARPLHFPHHQRREHDDEDGEVNEQLGVGGGGGGRELGSTGSVGSNGRPSSGGRRSMLRVRGPLLHHSSSAPTTTHSSVSRDAWAPGGVLDRRRRRRETQQHFRPQPSHTNHSPDQDNENIQQQTRADDKTKKKRKKNSKTGKGDDKDIVDLARKEIEREHEAKMAALDRALRRQEWKRRRFALKSHRDATVVPIEGQLDAIRLITMEQTVSGRPFVVIPAASLPSSLQRRRRGRSDTSGGVINDPLDDADATHDVAKVGTQPNSSPAMTTTATRGGGGGVHDDDDDDDNDGAVPEQEAQEAPPDAAHTGVYYSRTAAAGSDGKDDDDDVDIDADAAVSGEPLGCQVNHNVKRVTDGDGDRDDDGWDEEANEKVYWDWDRNDAALQRLIRPFRKGQVPPAHAQEVSSSIATATRERNYPTQQRMGINRHVPENEAELLAVLHQYCTIGCGSSSSHHTHKSMTSSSSTSVSTPKHNPALKGGGEGGTIGLWDCEPRTARKTLDRIFYDDDAHSTQQQDSHENDGHKMKKTIKNSISNPHHEKDSDTTTTTTATHNKDLLICASGKLSLFYTNLSMDVVHLLSRRALKALLQPSRIGGMIRALTATFLMQESEALGGMLEEWTRVAFPPETPHTSGTEHNHHHHHHHHGSLSLTGSSSSTFDAMSALSVMRRSWSAAWQAAQPPLEVELTAPAVTQYEQQQLQAATGQSSAPYNDQQQRVESPFELLSKLEFQLHLLPPSSSSSSSNYIPSTEGDVNHHQASSSSSSPASWLSLLPTDCIRRYSTLCRALIYWRWLDHISSMLWSASASKGAITHSSSSSSTIRSRRLHPHISSSSSIPAVGGGTNSTTVSGSGGIAAVPEVWLFATTVRAVLQPVMQHIWHGVSILSDEFRQRSHVVVVSSSRKSGSDEHHRRGRHRHQRSPDDDDDAGEISSPASSSSASSSVKTVARLKEVHELFLSKCFAVCLLSPELEKSILPIIQSMAGRVDHVNRLVQWSRTTYALEAADRAAISKLRRDFLSDAFKFTQALRSSAAAEDPAFSNFLSTLQHVVAQCRRR